MVGHPKHVQKALDAGADMICAQGGEGGGHTGSVPTIILIPAVCKAVAGKKSPLTGKAIQVIAGGGLYNGATVAAALVLGASAVWIGTRFILSDEAGASKAHREAVRTAGFDDTIRTIIFTVSYQCRGSGILFQRLIVTGPTTPCPQDTLYPRLGRQPFSRDQRTNAKGDHTRAARPGKDGGRG